MSTTAETVRELSLKYARVENVMRFVNIGTMKEAHLKQDGRKATGVDKVTKAQYGENLDENLEDLYNRMRQFQYHPQMVRRVEIEKEGKPGKFRPLGIPAYEDRLVQRPMADILAGVYEPRFLDCSYGFRPGRSCHDVVKQIDNTVMFRPVNFVLEADIKGFFDNVNHEWLLKFLEHDIADKNFTRYVARFLKAGVMKEAEVLLKRSEKGTPQGGLISPTLANVYLHYALDLWAKCYITPRTRGYVEYLRYADDFIFLFQYKEDADWVMRELPSRLGKFGLELAMDKTRIFPFGRNDRGKNRFDFLGFTFYEGRTRTGKYRVGVKTSEKKLKAKRANLKQWMKRNMHTKPDVLLKSLNRKLIGHCNYYGVNGNFRCLGKFYRYAQRCVYHFLNRRGQRKSVTWERVQEIWNQYIRPPRICVQIWGR